MLKVFPIHQNNIKIVFWSKFYYKSIPNMSTLCSQSSILSYYIILGWYRSLKVTDQKKTKIFTIKRKMQISTQNWDILIMPTQGNFMTNIKAILQVEVKIIIFLPKKTKIFIKNRKVQILTLNEQISIRSIWSTYTPKIKAICPVPFKKK